jgi:hypothetical protein
MDLLFWREDCLRGSTDSGRGGTGGASSEEVRLISGLGVSPSARRTGSRAVGLREAVVDSEDGDRAVSSSVGSARANCLRDRWVTQPLPSTMLSKPSIERPRLDLERRRDLTRPTTVAMEWGDNDEQSQEGWN